MPLRYNPETGQYEEPVAEDFDAMAMQQTAPTPPQPQPYRMDPQKFLKEAYGINTMGPKADEAAETARNYNADQHESFDRLGQNQPQQFGTAETTDSYGGDVLTPKETAERLPTNSNAMDELARKHLLPSVPQSSRNGYDNYVTAEREKRASEKAFLRQQGALNRADAAEKDAQAWNQTLNLNGLQGGGLGPSTGASSASMGNGSSAGPIQKVGGYTFVSGRWRPMTAEEQAGVNLRNAQADYYRQRPDIEGNRQDSLDERLRKRIEATAEENDKKLKASSDKTADATARADRMEFDKILNMMRQRDQDAAAQVEANTPSAAWNYVPWSGGSKPPYREQYLDMERDAKNPNKFVPSKNTYASMRDRLLMLADKLEKMHANNVSVGEMPDDVIDYVTELRKARGS